MVAKLKNILRCYAVGMGIKETANTFHLSRNTVRKYVRLFISSGKTTEQLLELSEEHLREMFGCTEFRHREPSQRQLELDALIQGYVARLSQRGIRTLYANASKLLGQLKVAKVKNNLESELKKIERCQLLILDDLFLVPLDAKERPILLDIIEDRLERKSIIITSQYPPSAWYDMVGDPTVADAILDRIVHSAHTIELSGESMRKLKAKK